MLKVDDLSKRFGDLQAVSHINFEIQPGEIMGLIGQNGAGKTTTFRMILKFIEPDTGSITWNGHPMNAKDFDQLGYLPEERGLFPKMTIEEQIVYFAQLRGQNSKTTRSRIDQWMDDFQVKGQRKDKIKDLSKGNQQKVQLIATLIHEPKFIILDEPFSGLDPVNASLLEMGIKKLRDSGSAIIFSSHDMSNVTQISDHLLMLKQGEVVLTGKVNEVRESFGRTRLSIQSPLTKTQLEAFQGVIGVEKQGEGFEVSLENEAAGHAIFDAATENGYIPEFSQQPPSLDEIFRMKAGTHHG